MRHRVGERAHAVPAQLHVEVQAAANDVQVVVDQARQDAPALQIDDAVSAPASGITSRRGRRRANWPSVIATAWRVGLDAIERGEQPAMQDELGRSRRNSSFVVLPVASLGRSPVTGLAGAA